MTKPKSRTRFRTQFSDREDFPIFFDEKEGLTHQSPKDECDINTIVSKFNKTGELPAMIKANPQYGDFSQALDYQSALDLVHHAETQFAALPSVTRERFDNDPAQFLAFAEDARNVDQMVEWGLAQKRPESGVATPPSAPPARQNPAGGNQPGPAAGGGPDA